MEFFLQEKDKLRLDERQAYKHIRVGDSLAIFDECIYDIQLDEVRKAGKLKVVGFREDGYDDYMCDDHRSWTMVVIRVNNSDMYFECKFSYFVEVFEIVGRAGQIIYKDRETGCEVIMSKIKRLGELRVGDKLRCKKTSGYDFERKIEIEDIDELQIVGFVLSERLIFYMINGDRLNCWSCPTREFNSQFNIITPNLADTISRQFYFDLTTNSVFKLIDNMTRGFGFEVQQRVRCLQSLPDFNYGDLTVVGRVVGFSVQSGKCVMVVMKQDDPNRCFGFSDYMAKNLVKV